MKKQGIIISAIILFFIALILIIPKNHGDKDNSSRQPSINEGSNKNSEKYIENIIIEGFTDGDLTLPWDITNKGIRICRFGEYTGAYFEDGLDEKVFNVAAIVITNTSDNPIEYGEISISTGEEKDNLLFIVTALPSGESCLVLESEGKKFSHKILYEYDNALISYYSEGFKDYSSTYSINNHKNMAIGIKNKGNKDIENDIYVYYKTYSNDIYIGGITYRAKIENGLKAGESTEVKTRHFISNRSRILFVTDGYNY